MADVLSQDNCIGPGQGPTQQQTEVGFHPPPPGDVTARTAHTSAQHKVYKQCDAPCGPAGDIK